MGMGKFTIPFAVFLCAFYSITTLYGWEEKRKNDNFEVRYVDSNSPTKTWWPNDTKCSRFQVGFGKNLRMTYLISYPRSGNTWTRYMIESVTGYFTNSDGYHHDFHSNSIVIFRLGFLGELEPLNTGRTILSKAHEDFEQNNSEFSDSTPVILIVRNPKNAIISFWSFMYASKEEKFTHKDNISLYNFKEFHVFVAEHIEIWSKMNEERLNKSKNLLLIFYEDLVRNPLKEVDKMLKFLNFRADQERLDCLNQHFTGPAKRHHEKEKIFRITQFDPFNLEEKNLIQTKLLSFSNLAKSKGYEVPSSYLDSFPSQTTKIHR